jgi:hypothetical protein
LFRRARQMRLPTSYNPPLAHRANPVPPRPRNLLPSSIEQPKPRAAISSLLSLPSHQPHGANGASPTAIGRPTFSSARSTDDDHHHRQRTPRENNHNHHHYNDANRREEPSPPPSPTARSVVSQPPTTLGGGGGDSEAARVSLWAELKDIRRRSRTPGAGMAKEPSSA